MQVSLRRNRNQLNSAKREKSTPKGQMIRQIGRYKNTETSMMLPAIANPAEKVRENRSYNPVNDIRSIR